MYDVPPIGAVGTAQAGDLVQFVKDLANESRRKREPEEREWDEGHTLFLEGTTKSEDKFIVNLIQNQVIAFVDVQTKEAPAISLEPACKGEQPRYFSFEGNELDPRTGELLQQQEAVNFTPKGTVIALTGDMVAEYFQSIFDYMWNKSRANSFARENLYYTNIYGTQFAMYEWDRWPILTNFPNKQFGIDPTKTDIGRSHFVIFTEIVSADEAMAKYPKWQKAIKNSAVDGKIEQLEGDGDYSSVYRDNEFGRKMATIRICWIRYQQTDMTPDEAVAQGGITARDIPTGGVIQADDPNNPGFMINVSETETLYFAEGYKDPVSPGMEGWPLKFETRQCVIINDDLVSDEVLSAFYDIPVLINRNVPKPHSPYGQGEPKRLKGIQDALNHVTGNIVAHTDNYNAPLVVAPESAREQLPEEYRKEGFVRPGMTIWAPDQLLKDTGGKVVSVVAPPQTSPSLIQTKQMIANDLDKVSGYAPVLQGQAPGAGTSGRAIGQLMDAATSMVSFKSQHYQDFLYRLANMIFHSITNHMTPDDLIRINSQYPKNIVAEMLRWVNENEISITVEVLSGSALLKEYKRELAFRLFAVGALDLETLLDRCGEDSTLIIDRLKKQQMQMSGAAVAPEASGQPQLNVMPPAAAPAQ